MEEREWREQNIKIMILKRHFINWNVDKKLFYVQQP
jgi:hypothetical protein